MKPNEEKAEQRRKEFIVKKFCRTYEYLIRLLRLKGFDIPLEWDSPKECFRGNSGIFVEAEQVGPGLVGTLYACAACTGYQQVAAAFLKTKTIPKNAQVQCCREEKPCLGVMKPIILYPLLKKPITKPFIIDIPGIGQIITHYVIEGKKFRVKSR